MCYCGKEVHEEELAPGLFYWVCPEHGVIDCYPSTKGGEHNGKTD